MKNSILIEDTKFEGVKIIYPYFLEDKRGYFLKNFEKDIFINFGIKNDIYESFESFSYKNVIRGLHFQINQPQVKLVQVIRGQINDVIVDLRKDSKTFGQWEKFDLSGDNHKMLYIPAGFAHGFEVITDYAIMSYKCMSKYSKGTDSGIIWNDKDLNINWSVENPIVSDRDEKLGSFKEFVEKYQYLGN